MVQHVDSSCSCPRDDYSSFDSICRQELTNKMITADAIVNHSKFCTSFQLDTISVEDQGNLQLRDFLFGLNDKAGIYHIWIEEAYCYEHNRYAMLGVYVGKGVDALERIMAHVKENKLPQTELFGVSFFECDNRIAKYLEQLFLDVYKFHINKNENHGDQHLYACWDEDRRVMGTELHNVANRPKAETED